MKSSISFLSVMVAVFGGISVIAGAVMLYKNNVWSPKVEVISFDLPNGTAVVMINGIQQTMYGDDIVAAGGDWGVRLVADTINGVKTYDRIELVKNGLVQEILYKES